jgi:membrane protein implicated in regulation of membrane protease activity
MHYWIWLALAGGFLVLEILTLSFIFFSFAIAASIAAIGAATWVGSSFQWIGFAVTAVLSLAVIRPLVRKYLFSKSNGGGTGVDALLNHEALTLTDISGMAGTIRLRDETWTARCDAGSIPKDTKVLVVRIDGAIAIVVPKVPSTSA